ncbi:MAG: c-type cytochrome domain-containing protein [Opitutaceae bacterium]
MSSDHGMTLHRLLACTVAAFTASSFGIGRSFAAEAAPEFNRHIRRILSDNCFHCHGSDEGSRKAKLRLDVRENALRGGKSGLPAIVPGKPNESELLLRVRAPHGDEDHMPPADSNRAPLKPADIEKLR